MQPEPFIGGNVALSGDTLVICCGDDGVNVYERSGNTWTKEMTLDVGYYDAAVAGDSLVISALGGVQVMLFTAWHTLPGLASQRYADDKSSTPPWAAMTTP